MSSAIYLFIYVCPICILHVYVLIIPMKNHSYTTKTLFKKYTRSTLCALFSQRLWKQHISFRHFNVRSRNELFRIRTQRCHRFLTWKTHQYAAHMSLPVFWCDFSIEALPSLVSRIVLFSMRRSITGRPYLFIFLFFTNFLPSVLPVWVLN